MEKNRLARNLMILFGLTLMITYLFCDIQTYASPEATVYVSPDTTTASIGDNITIGVMIREARDLSSWQLALEYNGSLLNCTAVWLPDNHVFADKNFFATEVLFGPTATENMFLTTGAVSLEGGVDILESSVICQMNFTVEQLGSTNLRIGTLEHPIDGNVGGSFEKWDTFLLNSNVMRISFDDVSGLFTTGEVKISPNGRFTMSKGRPLPENVRLLFLPQSGIPVFYVGEPILFNASLSNDRDGTITKYEWNFGDGNTTVVETPIVYYTYTNVSLGNTITLTVWDNDNLSSKPYTQKIEIGLILTPVDVGPYMILLVAIIVLAAAVLVVRRIMRRRQP